MLIFKKKYIPEIVIFIGHLGAWVSLLYYSNNTLRKYLSILNLFNSSQWNWEQNQLIPIQDGGWFWLGDYSGTASICDRAECEGGRKKPYFILPMGMVAYPILWYYRHQQIFQASGISFGAASSAPFLTRKYNGFSKFIKNFVVPLTFWF